MAAAREPGTAFGESGPAGPPRAGDAAPSAGGEPASAARAPGLEYGLLLMFVRNELAAQAAILLLAAIFSLASMFWAPWTQAAGWLVLVVAAKVVLLECCRRFALAPEAEVDVAAWRRRLVLAEAVNGVAWAGFALIGMGGAHGTAPDHLFSADVFVFAFLIVVLAIRITFASTVMPILYVGTVPMTLAVVVRLGLLGDFFYLALASMAVGVHVYFVFLAKGLNSTARAMLAFRAQKDELIAALEQARSISEEARRRAEAANLAKSRFLATMSHELRTPLNAILGFSEVMQAEIMGPIRNQIYKDYAAGIHRSGSHLLNLINEILDLSRIEAGRYDLNQEPVWLVDIVEECHRLLKLKAESKHQHIFERFEEGLPRVCADERAVRQICLNLLSNALKFTPRDGRITLGVWATADGGQLISVRDTGPGIPREEIPKVMQAFGQGSLALETAEGGTGLGLPIVQSLIELHGGSFELRSEPRKGTEAIVYFPPQRVLAAPAPLQPGAADPGRLAGRNRRPARARHPGDGPSRRTATGAAPR